MSNKQMIQTNRKKRNNAKLYPIYKMFSWDLLFYYSIQFLFYTITKQVPVSSIIIIEGIYQFFNVILGIPAVVVNDVLGRRNSIVLGNIILLFYVPTLIFLPGTMSILIADFVFAIGYNIKSIAETNLLYDSVSTKGGDGLYSKIDSKGVSWYYIFDGVASLVAGYLFVINNYLPMIICFGFTFISTMLSFRFKEIYPKANTRKTIKNSITEYGKELKTSIKNVLKSKRIRALILFGMVFTAIISISDTYRKDLLVELGIGAEQFSVILALLSMLAGICVNLQRKIEHKFRNRTLCFLSTTYIISCILIAISAIAFPNDIAIPIVLLLCVIQYIIRAIWWVLEEKYQKNFTTPEQRSKVSFIYAFFAQIGISILVVLGGEPIG